MNAPPWMWIPIVLLAAAAQTVRNAAQKDLVPAAGTLAATSVRFVYGLPFALLALALVFGSAGVALPTPGAAFVAWVCGSALAQLVATGLLIAAMQRRSFVVALAYSKTEVLRVAAFSWVLLGEPVGPQSLGAIVLASIGLWLLAAPDAGTPADSTGRWATAWMGIGSGAGFALSAVGYRAAAQSLGPFQPWQSAAYVLVWAQAVQSVAICALLLCWRPAALRATLVAWRVSTLAGAFGALASFGWFTAFALRNAADVRTLALVEVLYGYGVSRCFFGERVGRREAVGIGLLVLGIAVISAQW